MRMQAPQNAESCSFDGKSYEVVKGFVNVPDRAAIPLMSHGYAVAGEAKDPEAVGELAALAKKQEKVKRLDDARTRQMLAKGAVQAAQTSGEAEKLNAALTELALANAELEAATAGVAAQ
jgi:hypothetical protein